MTRVALRGATVALVAVGLFFALRGLSPALLGRSLASANATLLLTLALPLLALGSVLRTARYGVLLPGRDATPWFALWSAVMLSTAGNNVLPLRGGELLRTKETVGAGYALSRVAIAQVGEKALEGISIVLLSLPVILARLDPRWATVGALTLLLLAVPLGRWLLPRARLSLAQLAVSFGWSLLADVVEVALVAVCLASLRLPASALPSLTVFAAVNVAILLPSTPGNLGTFEAGAALPLVAMGVDRDAAVAFALVYRAVQWIPVNLVGLLLWVRSARTPASVEAS